MFNFIKSAYRSRKLILNFSVRDITSSHTGSLLGSTWVFIDPAVNVILTLFIFQFALKSSATANVPYAVWVMPVIIFWIFISTSINSSVFAVKDYAYLIRHSDFDLRLVIVIKIMGVVWVHLSLMTLVLLALWFSYNIPIGLHLLALIYYLVAMGLLLMAIGWVLSSIGVFWKDVRNFVGIFVQIEFWISPIFWEPDRFPGVIQIIMYANPFYYPMHGYRSTVMGSDYGPHFWTGSLYFWCFTSLLLVFGSILFRKLSKEFGDVL